VLSCSAASHLWWENSRANRIDSNFHPWSLLPLVLVL
jgi:hypothetical protein